MEILKLTSVRLSKSALARANELGKSMEYCSTSDVLRVAIWLGLKFLKPGVLHEFMQMMWQEESHGADYCAADVLRTAVDSVKNLKSFE